VEHRKADKNKNHGTKTYQLTPRILAKMATTDYFERKLDDKRRLTIPAELRAEFASGVVLTRGFKQYLHLYSQAVWDEDVEEALVGDILDERIADLNVSFRTGKIGAELDEKQGRITIEQHLLDFAGITSDVVVVRAGKYWRISAAH
jgi:MraZ protein